MPAANGQVHIATWLYAEQAGEESVYPQVGGVPSSPRFQAVYWRCVALFFATSIRHNPQAAHRLYTNLDFVPLVDGFDLPAFLDRLGVEVVQVPFTFQPPAGYYGAWRNQFYVFDLIQDLARRSTPGDACLLLDSDCFWIDTVETLLPDLYEHGVLTYALDMAPDHAENGLSPRAMQAIFADLLERPVDAIPVYCGGEFFAATGAEAKRVAAELDPLWQEQLRRFNEGRPKFNEEAHALSFVYYKLGYAYGTANRYIKRIWTVLFRDHTAVPADYRLTLWHLPAEKRYGIPRLFEAMRDPASPFWTLAPGRPLAAYMGRLLGIPRRAPGKFIADLRVAVRYKLRQALGLDTSR